MRNIIKQSSWMLFALALTRVISFFYIIFLARTLGVSGFGLYTVALAYFSIISSIADFGFNRFLTREIAIDKSKALSLFWNIAFLRLTLTSVLFAIFSLVLYFQDPDKIRVSLILLATLAILPQSLAFTVDAVFVAIQKLQFSGISLFVSSLSTALIGFFLITRGYGVIGAVSALILGQVVYFIVLTIFLHKYQKLSLSSINPLIMKNAVAGSFPYAILSVLGLLYFKIDAILLSYLRGNFETGIYGAAYKFLESVIFIPSAFSAAIFPILAKLHNENIGEVKRIYFKSIKLMIVVGFLLFLAYFLMLPFFIKQFLPNYIQAIDAIKILSISIPFIFMAAPGVQVLFSSGKYLKTVVLLSSVMVTLNIVLNLIFIPKFGFIAAAWITVASDIISFVVFYLLIKKKIFQNAH